MAIFDLLVGVHLVVRRAATDSLVNNPRVVLVDIDHLLAHLWVVKLALVDPLGVKETDRLPVVAASSSISHSLWVRSSLRGLQLAKRRLEAAPFNVDSHGGGSQHNWLSGFLFLSLVEKSTWVPCLSSLDRCLDLATSIHLFNLLLDSFDLV